MTLSFFFPEIESVVIDALCKISVEMKASMMKAVMTAISGFKIMLKMMVVKMKTLLQSKVFVGTLMKVKFILLS